jgi:hypothetical protein
MHKKGHAPGMGHAPNGTSLRGFLNSRNGHLLRAELARRLRHDRRIARLPLPSVIAFLRKASSGLRSRQDGGGTNCIDR